MKKTNRRRSKGAQNLLLAGPRAYMLVLVVLGIIIITVFGTRLVFPIRAASDPQVHIITSLYAYPGTSPWTGVESSSPTVKYAIANICAPDGTGSGCGSPADEINSAWLPTIAALKNAGITPVYYISTNYGAIALATIESEIQKAITWYNLPSPMFDTTATGGTCSNGGSALSCTTYYDDLYNYSVNAGASVVVFNPGTIPSSSYVFGSKEIIQVFEGTASSFRATSFPSWMASYSASQFAATLSAGTSSTIKTDVTDSVKDNIGNFYEDDEAEPPNYSTLPAYWSAEVSDVAATDITSTPTPAPTHTATPKPTSTPRTTSTPAPSRTPAPTLAPSKTPQPTPISSLPVVGDNIALGSAGSTSGTVVKVDGNVVSTNGVLNTALLTNGRHTVTITRNGVTSTRTIEVNNHLSPYKTARNTLVAAFGTKQDIPRDAVILALLIAAAVALRLFFPRFIVYNRRRRPW